MHAAGSPQRVVAVEDPGGLVGDVVGIELEDGDMGEPDAGHPGLGSRGELEARRRPRAVRRAQRGQMDVVLPPLPFGFLVGAHALRVRDEETGRGQLDGITPPAAIHRSTAPWASAGE